MTSSGGSLGKVSYDLRPAKQVERLMLLDAFKRLECANFPVSRYHYVGMGSNHFYDYLLFHKFLGMTRMTSAEIEESEEKRVKFNKPFSFVKIRMTSIGTVVSSIPPEERVVLWLDYDDRLRAEFLSDFGLAVGRLASGSIVLLTVDVEPPTQPPLEKNWSIEGYYRDRLEGLAPASWHAYRFSSAHIVRTVLTLVERTLKLSLRQRATAGVSFQPIVCFTYKDGHRMLSLGGMIVTEQEMHQFKAAHLEDVDYYRSSFALEPFNIRVPSLTRRERLYLDANMPAPPRWKPAKFNLLEDDLESYKRIYRFAPAFGEFIA